LWCAEADRQDLSFPETSIVTEFTPLAALAGGVLIGLAAVLLMWTTGRVAGISGIVARLLPPYRDNDTLSRAGFVLGLLTGPLAYTLFTGATVPFSVTGNMPMIVAAGLLVGFGAFLGGGCTSGHGVCGLARLSTRSLAATATFMAAGLVTVYVIRHVI
jgi:hypothetical protein